MNANKAELIDRDLTEHVIGVFFDVFNELGAGFVESVYENALAIALRQAGFRVAQQFPLAVSFRNQNIGEFRVDLLVEDRIVIELKAVSQLLEVHEVQLVNYLRASGAEVGLLLNFGQRPEFKRRIFTKKSVSIRVDPRQK